MSFIKDNQEFAFTAPNIKLIGSEIKKRILLGDEFAVKILDREQGIIKVICAEYEYVFIPIIEPLGYELISYNKIL